VKDPHGACARTKEGDIICIAAMVVIKGKRSICGGFKVISGNALAWISLAVDRLEIAIIITQNPHSARARTVEDEMISFAHMVVIEGKDTITSRFEVVSTDAGARVTLLIDGCERPAVVTQNPYCSCSGAI